MSKKALDEKIQTVKINAKIDPIEFAAGLADEADEHGWDAAIDTVLAHLKQDPKYYTKLRKAGLMDKRASTILDIKESVQLEEASQDDLRKLVSNPDLAVRYYNQVKTGEMSWGRMLIDTNITHELVNEIKQLIAKVKSKPHPKKLAYLEAMKDLEEALNNEVKSYSSLRKNVKTGYETSDELIRRSAR